MDVDMLVNWLKTCQPELSVFTWDFGNYCWRKKSGEHHFVDSDFMWFPTIYDGFYIYIRGGFLAGFLNHQQYELSESLDFPLMTMIQITHLNWRIYYANPPILIVRLLLEGEIFQPRNQQK